MAKLLNKKTTPAESTAAGRKRAAPDNSRDTPASSGEVIAKVAYELWLERGSPIGSPEQDWFRAEQLLNAGEETEELRSRSRPAVISMILGAGAVN
jgi:Protein of unknown function (DUF2934)